MYNECYMLTCYQHLAFYITNVYKPPGTRLCLDSLPRHQQPCIYAGDFNCHSTRCGCSSTNTDGTSLEHWTSNTDVTLILNSLVASAQHDVAHRQIRICVLPILEHVRVGESSNAFRRPNTDNRLSSHRQPSTRCQRVLSIDGTFGRRTGRSSQTDSTLQPTSSPAQRQNRTQPIKHGAQQSYQRRRRPYRGVPQGPDSSMGRGVPTTVYYEFTRAEPGAITNMKAEQLTNTHDEKRRERWESTTASIDFTHSIRQAWQTFNRLTGRAKKTPPCPVSANAIASKVIENGCHRNVEKQAGRDVNAEIATPRGSVTTGDTSLTETFTEAEMQAAVSNLKTGKAQCPYHIAPALISNCGTLMWNWLREFFLLMHV